MNENQKNVMEIIQNSAITYEQKTSQLAKYAENLIEYPIDKDDDFFKYYEEGSICDLWEGHAPYAPRYILPDYDLLMKKGSKFLRLDPPKTLREAISTLLIFYSHVPSITRYPVYIGQIDKLLNPFIKDEKDAYDQIKWFLIHLDRTINDSFCHANIGPEETKVGRIILEILPKLQNVTPNMTLKYDPDITPDDFAKLAVLSSLECANPAFSNDKVYRNFHKGDYGIASCYNALPLNGGAYTLSRLRLQLIAKRSKSIDDFLNNELVKTVETMNRFMESKIDFLVEKTPFFKSNFLVKEGFIDKDRFVGLFGMVGLDECVDTLLEKEGKSIRYGVDEEADQLGQDIVRKINELVNSFESKYSKLWDNHFMLHAQVGAQDDDNNTAGVRVSVDKELPIYKHIKQAGKLHPLFPSGIGDYYPFDDTAKNNPMAVVDIFKGAFKEGMNYIAAYGSNSDLVRVTGYLVKRSDLEAYKNGSQVSYDTVQYAHDAVYKYRILQREKRNV